MTFKANLLPNSDLGYSLGSSDKKWKINGQSLGTAAFKNESGTWAISISGSSASCTGNAATATKLSNTPSNTTTFLRGDNTWTNTLIGPLRLGGPDTASNTGYITDNVGSNNYIAFYGVYGDAVGSYNHCYIGERIYGSKSTTQEQSELLLFKGNDIGTTNPGPDRIRLLAAQIDIQCYTSALSGSFMAVGETGGAQVCKFRPDGITSSVNITAPQFIGQMNFTSGGIWPAPQNISCTGDNSEWSFDMSGVNSYWHVWSGKNGASCLQCFNNDRHVWAYNLQGAVWNDYAEYRHTDSEIEPGRCIREIGNDTLILTTERLMRGCEIVSDTYGFSVGKSQKNNTPTAASGRVLAYPYESLEEFKKHIGWPVCSGPNGTVSIMTEEEEEKYPSRIIGTISSVPDYEEWQCGDEKKPEYKKVNGRVWIRIR